ncbi:MAG: hypothetical protein DRN99_07725 [Thermoproteota archaeon]|nr:MAG: hypothetical protein DRN99_07725 [Candidatus Korarchaeota archaeon]
MPAVGVALPLVEDVISWVKDSFEDCGVMAVALGLKYACVALDTGGAGVAYVFREWHSVPGCCGGLWRKSAFELVDLARSWNLSEASIGTAAINAFAAPLEYEVINVSRRIAELSKECRKVVFVGYFKPLLKYVESPIVLEKRPMPGVLPDEAYEEVLSSCDLAVISGSAFVNKSLERLLKASAGYTIVVGPTTPLTEVLFGYGADELAGAVVIDPGKALHIVMEGGGRHELGGALRFVSMKSRR